MQVFLVGTIFETAEALDRRRLNKQIIETRQILKAISGESKAWRNHPVVKMYSNNTKWLKEYLKCLEEYYFGNFEEALLISKNSENIRPQFTRNLIYLENMKRRLFTKDNSFYSRWASLGESYLNMYYVDNTWIYYEQKKS